MSRSHQAEAATAPDLARHSRRSIGRSSCPTNQRPTRSPICEGVSPGSSMSTPSTKPSSTYWSPQPHSALVPSKPTCRTRYPAPNPGHVDHQDQNIPPVHETGVLGSQASGTPSPSLAIADHRKKGTGVRPVRPLPVREPFRRHEPHSRPLNPNVVWQKCGRPGRPALNSACGSNACARQAAM